MVTIDSSAVKPLVQGLTIAGLTVGAFLGVRYLFREVRETAANNAAAANPESPAGLAEQIHAALHTGPFGMFEDEDKVLEIALRITDLEAVVKSYRRMYNVELLGELQRLMSQEQYEEFRRRTGGSLGQACLHGRRPTLLTIYRRAA